MLIRFYIFLFVLFAFTNCELVVNIDLPETPPKLVVVSFISPQDTLLRVYVGESVPIFQRGNNVNNPPKIIANATVQMISDTKSVTFIYKKEGYYDIKATNFLIEAGKTYKIEVSTPDGKRAKSKCTIPAQQNTSLQVKLENTQDSYTYAAQAAWKDEGTENNFYRLMGFGMAYLGPSEPIYYSDDVLMDWRGTDVGRQGTSISIRPDFNKYGAGTIPFPDNKEHYMLILLNTDEAYHKYITTRENAYYNDGNPFAEPIPVYTNIDGGLGIFAGYQQYRLEVLK